MEFVDRSAAMNTGRKQGTLRKHDDIQQRAHDGFAPADELLVVHQRHSDGGTVVLLLLTFIVTESTKDPLSVRTAGLLF